MRLFLSGSALVHAAVLGLALFGFAWPAPEDAPAPGVVTVDIVTTDTITTNQQAVLESSANQDLISAGTQATPSPVLDPLPTDMIEPVEPMAQKLPPTLVQPLPPPTAAPQVPAPSIEPVAPPPAALPVLTAAVQPIDVEGLLPVEPATMAPEPAPPAIEPIAVEDAKVAPVPHTLSRPRPATPTARPPAPRQANAAGRANAAAPARPAGNGGRNNADSAASKAASGQQGVAGGGGTADTAPWDKQVRRALANARRYPRGANGAVGEVTVSFTVSATGALLDFRIIASSGNGLLDQAASDTVNRAAPFPPLPAGLASKTVQLPLAFVRN